VKLKTTILLALVTTATGCGLSALIGALTATQLLNKGNGTNTIPTPVSVLTPSTTVFDRVEVAFLLQGQGPFDVLVEYSTTGATGSFSVCTEALGPPSQGTQALSASMGGNAHIFVWNSFFDLDAQGITSSADVVLRVTAFPPASGTPPANRTAFGMPSLTAPFQLDNRFIATVAGPPSEGGEGVPAADVPLVGPLAAVVASGTSLLVADTGGARVRLVDGVSRLVTTFAGSTAGEGGDGTPAVAAQLLKPSGLAVDSKGNVIIADSGNNRLREVDAVSNVIATIAGVASAGLSGDGGPATAAMIQGPTGVVVGASDVIYFCDTGNDCIRSVTNGTISRVAGTGTAGSTGDGGAATSAQLSGPTGLAIDATGALLVADTGNHAIRRVVPGGAITTLAGTLGRMGLGGEGVPAAGSALASPSGVSAIGAQIYVADTGNNRIRQFTSGGMIATVAGSTAGTSGFAGDNGSATAALLAGPTGLSPDGTGGVLVADTGNNRIRDLTASGLITTVVGSGSPDALNLGDGDLATNAQFKDIAQIALGLDGSVYVADDMGQTIRHFQIGGTISTVAGTGISGFSGDGGPATNAQLNGPFGVAIDQNGVIFIGEQFNAVVRAVSLDGTITTVFGGGTGPDGIATMTSLGGPEAIHSRRGLNELLVGDTAANAVRRLTYTVDAQGHVLNGVSDTVVGTVGIAGYSGDGGPATAALLSAPFDMAEDQAGNLYLLDQFAAVVRKFQIGGNITTIAGDGNCGYLGDGGPATTCEMCAFYIAFDDATGFIYVTDFTNNRVRRFQEGGNIDTVAGTGGVGDTGVGGPATSCPISLNAGIVVLSDGSVVTAGSGTKRVYRFTPGGTISVVAGRPTSAPRGDGGPAVAATILQPMPAVAPDGTLYVAELNFGRVRRVDSRTGVITTLVGKGVLGDVGFGGPLSDIFIDAVTGMTVDSQGNPFIAEINQSIIAKIDLGVGTVTTAVGVGPGATSGGDGGPALQATLQFPEGICFSPKTQALYFTDSAASVVRRVDAQSGIITTVAGGGTDPLSENIPATTAQLTAPAAVACDANETIYVANRTPESTVRAFTIGGPIVTVAGIPFQPGFNGDQLPAVQAELNNPTGLAVDSAGNLYISDESNNRVRRVDVAHFISTIAGTGEIGSGPDGVPAALSKLSGPRQISLDGHGNIYVGEEFGNRVRRFRLYP
jgi:sugar lactone lactonase YvrE